MKTITISFTDEAYRELCQSSQAYRFTESIRASDAVAIGIVDSIERGLPLHVFKTREEREAERPAVPEGVSAQSGYLVVPGMGGGRVPMPERRAETDGIPDAPHGTPRRGAAT